VVGVLRAEEANVLQARASARAHGWWDTLMRTMQGLRILYEHTSRTAEWARLVEEIIPDFVDTATDGPLPGREENWTLVTEYRVGLAEEARQWTEAERLQRISVEWDRQRASAALGLHPRKLSSRQRHEIRVLATSMHELGQIQRELGQPECVMAFEEDFNLSLRIGDQHGAAVTAFNLGHAYKDLPTIRDLAEAERWYRQSLELHADDRLGRSKTLDQLGIVARLRFREARRARSPVRELLKHLNAALALYLEALDMTPRDAIADLATRHNHLGNIYGDAGDLDRAMEHYRKAISYSEAAGDSYHAAQTRYSFGVLLAQSRRFTDAKEYALAALRGYQTFGDRAKDDVTKTNELIALIEKAQKAGGGELEAGT
jgi:tetratricopeptide (TPR) repeat protein